MDPKRTRLETHEANEMRRLVISEMVCLAAERIGNNYRLIVQSYVELDINGYDIQISLCPLGSNSSYSEFIKQFESWSEQLSVTSGRLVEVLYYDHPRLETMHGNRTQDT